MRRFQGYEIFTEQLTNSGTLDLRYARITGGNPQVNLNNGLIVSGGLLTSSDSGIFNNGINISGALIINGIRISSIDGLLFAPNAGYNPG